MSHIWFIISGLWLSEFENARKSYYGPFILMLTCEGMDDFKHRLQPLKLHYMCRNLYYCVAYSPMIILSFGAPTSEFRRESCDIFKLSIHKNRRGKNCIMLKLSSSQ